MSTEQKIITMEADFLRLMKDNLRLNQDQLKEFIASHGAELRNAIKEVIETEKTLSLPDYLDKKEK